MKTTIQLFNNSGHSQSMREFKRFRHNGRLSLNSVASIVDRRYPDNLIQPEFNIMKVVVNYS